MAAAFNSHGVAMELIDAGAQVGLRDDVGLSPLGIAVAMEHESMAAPLHTFAETP